MEVLLVCFILSLKEILIVSQISFFTDFMIFIFLVYIFFIYPIVLIKKNVWLLTIHSGVVCILLTVFKYTFRLTNRVYGYPLFLFLLCVFFILNNNKR